MRVLVTGGSGYIGAHVVRLLADRGDVPVVVDDFVTGRRERVVGLAQRELDLADASAIPLLDDLLVSEGVEAIVHFAARKRVDESVARPDWYFAQNVGGLRHLLDAARRASVDRVLFSSTAAVYSSAERPIREDDEARPSSPYGETKLAGEALVADFARRTSGRAVSLRYFNVAGAASPELADSGAHNLVPMVLDRVETGLPPVIFGNDYDTSDGTCVRDYIHVQDVAEAHLVVLDAMMRDPLPSPVYNVGTGRGASVREVVEGILQTARSALHPVVRPRRVGDPAIVVADVGRIREELGWTARFSLEDIIESAWVARRG